MKKFLSLVIAMAMLATCAFAAVPSDFPDVPNDWSKTAIENAIINGLLNGSNGKINASSNLTRAEMCAIISRAAKAQVIGDIDFADVKEANWFYNEIAKAFAMEVFYGSGTKARPNDPITREETMAIIARFLKLDAVNVDAILGEYPDANSVSNWARESVAMLIDSGYIKGANGKLNPKSNITRAEFATIMDRMVTTYISEAKTVSENLTNVMVNTVNGGTTLKDMTINGNLIIGDGVGSGNITLTNVTITGRLLVRGGKSIKVNGGSVNTICVASDNSTVTISRTTTYNEKNGKVLEDAENSKIIVEKGSSGGGGGAPAPSVTPETLGAFEMIVAGSAVNGVITGDAATGYKVAVDLSAKAADAEISKGKATTGNGTELKIGDKYVKTNTYVSIYDLLGIVGSDKVQDTLTIDKLAYIVENIDVIYAAHTGNALPANVITVDGNTFSIKATMTRGTNVTNVVFEIKLP